MSNKIGNKPQSPLNRSNRKGSSTKDGTDRNSDIATEDLKSIAAHDATGETTRSLDSTAEEVGTAGGFDAVVQLRLVLEDQAVVDTRGIGVVGHERDVRRHDVPRAAGAESGRVGGGLEEQEGEVGRCKGGGVGDERCITTTSHGAAAGREGRV